jgi:hypothetical protein
MHSDKYTSNLKRAFSVLNPKWNKLVSIDCNKPAEVNVMDLKFN